jgi:hypothetical protein
MPKNPKIINNQKITIKDVKAQVSPTLKSAVKILIESKSKGTIDDGASILS